MTYPLDLTNVKVSDTFPRLIQTDGTGGFYDGLGAPISFGPSGTGPTGPPGASLSTLYSSGPGGNPSIVPGKVSLNTPLDVVDSKEYFDSNYLGIYFQSFLPSVNVGDVVYLGLNLYGGGLTYYGKIFYNSGPYIEIYKGATLIASGNYVANDQFSIYLDGVNARYFIDSNGYQTSQTVNGRFSCTLLPSSLVTSPLEFDQFLYYPTGKIGVNGSPGPTGPTGPYSEFYFQSSPPSPNPTNLGARWIDNDTGVEYVWVFDGVNYLWMQPTQIGGFQYSTRFVNVSSYLPSFAYEYYGVIYTGGICNITLPLGNVSIDEGKIITIADEVGGINGFNRGIQVQGTGGQLINGETSVLMKIDRMSLTFMFRNNSWKTI